MIYGRRKHLLTVLVEDYFHVGAFNELIRESNWSHFEPRFEYNTLKTLDLLDEYDKKGTFFMLGWIAEQSPELIVEIVRRGHEVASRGFYHRPIDQLTSEEFRTDLLRARDAIENAGGQKVVGYRSATKLSFEKNEHVLKILAEEGFAYDASFMPSMLTEKRKRFAHQFHSDGTALWEFPYATRNLGAGLLPISGGNYFRQIPFTLLRHAISDWTSRYDAPFMMYFHVWELDPEQPRISAASRYNRIRHYRKLDKMEWVVRELLANYDFSSISNHLGIETINELNIVSRERERIDLVSEETKSVRIPVSVVIPCFNESEALPYLANVLRKLEDEMKSNGFQPTIIFVDDCSTDNTVEVLNSLFGNRESVVVIRHKENLGVAGSIKTGIDASLDEIVCSMDCDCTYDPMELVNMIPLLNEDVDLVTASPYHRNGKVRNVPEWRLFLSKGASWLYRRTLKSKLATYTSCFRVYRRSSIIDINTEENGFLGVAEMLGRLDLVGGKIVEYPAVLEVRLFGVSKMKTARTVFGHLKLLRKLGTERFLLSNRSINRRINEEGKIEEVK